MMMLTLAALSLLATTELADVPVDPVRLQQEITADADVVRSLKSNRDASVLVRPVDVRFKGPQKNLRILADFLRGQGWIILQTVKLDGSEYALDTQHAQNTEEASLKDLTTAALKIERVFGVNYDGWGCVAQTGPKH